jgi:polyhydroxyalkanoate synthesis repressor PhaR
MTYIIKRYSNRKLYDPQQSRYVTLEMLDKLVTEGKEISVVDLTGNDLTSMTLIQILLERQRTRRGALASGLLHQMIRHGEARQDFLQGFPHASIAGTAPGQHDADQIRHTGTVQVGLAPPEKGGRQGENSQVLAQDAASLRLELEALRKKLKELEQQLEEKEDR